MTNETRNTLKPIDFKIMASLSEGTVPYHNPSETLCPEILPPETRLVYEGINLDLDKMTKYRAKSAFKEKYKSHKWDDGIEVYADEEDKITTNFGWCFDLTEEDLIKAVRNIGIPSTAMNKFKATFGKMIFDKMHEIKGYTVGPNSKDYIEHDGVLYPKRVTIYDITKVALQEGRQHLLEERIAPLHEFDLHCKSVPIGKEFLNLEALCKELSLNQKNGHTYVFSSKCKTPPRIDEQKRILNPVFHYIVWQDENSLVVGNVAFRPILTNGEIVTPEVIHKYLS